MIQKISSGHISAGNRLNNTTEVPAKSRNITVSRPNYSVNYTATGLVNAYQALNNIQTAHTVSFGQGLRHTFDELRSKMYTCHDETAMVGTRYPAQDIIDKLADDLPNVYDAIKMDVNVLPENKGNIVNIARTKVEKRRDGILYEMALRQPRDLTKPFDKKLDLAQDIKITADPGIKERTSVLNTKGKLIAVVEDGDYVLLTKAGTISKKADVGERLRVETSELGNIYGKFEVDDINTFKVADRKREESVGEGTDIVIGMENGRFVPEIIKSIEDFITKIESGEVVLQKFVANPNAKNIQLSMLAGGYGSRAEYTNASSSGIFHGDPEGAQSTKGVFRTATGFTPMETTLITLHNAGIIDCNNLKIGKNIKFYLNKSGVNKGNGGFTIDLYNTMIREGRNALAIFPNDSMSRLTNATEKMMDKINSGDAAIVMIAKEKTAASVINKFGIMKLNDNNEILEFAEKPDVIPEGYEKNGKCLTNTFQFAVSKEAFEALALVEKYLPPLEYGAESRDWSKVLTPVIMAITQNDDLHKMQQEIKEKMDKVKEFKGKQIDLIPISILAEAKQILGNQKVYAVPTDEPWADCGALNDLFQTTMDIASNQFKVEDFERKHVLDSINTKTGLITSTPEMKEYVEKNYDIDGEVMVVPQAEYVPPSLLDQYIENGLVTINPPAHSAK